MSEFLRDEWECAGSRRCSWQKHSHTGEREGVRHVGVQGQVDVQRWRAPDETAQEEGPADRVQPPLRAVCNLWATRTKEVVRKGSEFFLGGGGGAGNSQSTEPCITLAPYRVRSVEEVHTLQVCLGYAGFPTQILQPKQSQAGQETGQSISSKAPGGRQAGRQRHSQVWRQTVQPVGTKVGEETCLGAWAWDLDL